MSSMGKKEGTKETPAQRALAQRIVKMTEVRNQRLRPLERQMVKRGLDTSQDKAFVRGNVNAQQANAFGRAAETVEQDRITGGLAGAIDSVTADGGASRGLALNDADAAVEDVGINNKLSLLDRGLGKEQRASAGFGDLARDSAARALEDAEVANQNAAGKIGMVSSALAIGANGLQTAMPSATGVKTSYNMPKTGAKRIGAGGIG